MKAIHTINKECEGDLFSALYSKVWIDDDQTAEGF